MTTLFAVGLTGGIGCGKTTISDMFAAKGVAIVDTDRIAHQLTTPGGVAIPAILAAFGKDFITADGAMDRTRMRELVFTDPHEKKRLEAILHPLIQNETQRAAELACGPYLIFVVPLLVESGKWRTRVARILVIDCPESLQIARVMNRNGLNESQVRAIMATQVSRKERIAAADDIIVNDSDVAALIPQVDRLHALYLSQTAARA